MKCVFGWCMGFWLTKGKRKVNFPNPLFDGEKCCHNSHILYLSQPIPSTLSLQILPLWTTPLTISLQIFTPVISQQQSHQQYAFKFLPPQVIIDNPINNLLENPFVELYFDASCNNPLDIFENCFFWGINVHVGNILLSLFL